jgi:gluconolactonase
VPDAEVVATGIPFGEGPVWCPDGTLVCVSVAAGDLRRIEPSTGAVTIVATTAGGPNAASLATDGSFLVTQNGGIDFVALGHMDAVDAPPFRPIRPGIQRAWPDGRVEYLSDVGMQAPNDLAIADDGSVYFTDPGDYATRDQRIARIMQMTPDGAFRVVANDFVYVNGIAVGADGTSLIVVENEGLLRICDLGTGERHWLARSLEPGGADGLCLDADGCYDVASKSANGVRVLDSEGAEIEFLALPGHGFVTNCCFGGTDRTTLFATEARGNCIVAWEHMPTPGLPLVPWHPTA